MAGESSDKGGRERGLSGLILKRIAGDRRDNYFMWEMPGVRTPRREGIRTLVEFNLCPPDPPDGPAH